MSEKLGTNLAEVGTDTISRKQAIDALNEYFVRIGKLKRRGLNKGEKAISLDTVGAINSLPPAQPQRTGKWIYHIDDLFPAESTQECDQCHSEQSLACDDNYCPNCGAKMMPRND